MDSMSTTSATLLNVWKTGALCGPTHVFLLNHLMGEISKAIHGKGNVSGEVYWSVHSEKILENEIKLLPNGKAKDLLKEIMASRHTPRNENLEVGEQCYIMKPLVKMNNISPSLAKEISIYLKFEEDKLQKIDIFKAVKIQRNRFVFYNKQCGRVKQNNSYTVLLQQPIKGCDIVQVEYFIHCSSPRKTIGVCSGFQRVHKLVQGRALHIQVLELNRQEEDNFMLVPVSLFEEHVVYMEASGKKIIARFPNFIERD